MTSQDADYLRMQSPQASAIGAAAQQKVASVLLQISGVGGLGNSIAMHLASAGFRRISINDPQNLELDNLSRFPCATLANIILQTFFARSVSFNSLLLAFLVISLCFMYVQTNYTIYLLS